MHLEKCLTSLEQVRSETYKLEIIVVDNCSNDGRFEQFQNRFPTVRFVLNSGNYGFSHGCNRGAAGTKAEYLLFLNSDIIANTEGVFGMLETLRSHPDITLLSCRQQNDSGKEEHLCGLFPHLYTLNGIPRALYKLVKRKQMRERFSIERELIYPDWVSGSVMMISAVNFLRTGGWCEDYWLYYEDVELCWRVNELGGTVALTNRFSLIHNHGGATRINPQTAALTKAEVRTSKHVFVARHYSGFTAFLMHLVTIIGVLLGKLIPAVFSIPFFYVMNLRTYGIMYMKVLGYYWEAVGHRCWISPRSVTRKHALPTIHEKKAG